MEKKVFKERIEYLAGQYVHLMESLQKYAEALSLAGKGPRRRCPLSASGVSFSAWAKEIRNDTRAWFIAGFEVATSNLSFHNL